MNLLPKMDRECIENDSRMDRQSLGKIFRYAAMITLLLTLACGNVWGKYLYLNTANLTGWEGDNATFKLYPGTGSDVTGVKVYDHMYRFDVPKATGTMYFKRYNSDGSTKWNEFPVEYNSSYNVYKVTSWDRDGCSKECSSGNYDASVTITEIYLDVHTKWYQDSPLFKLTVNSKTYASTVFAGTNLILFSVPSPSGNLYFERWKSDNSTRWNTAETTYNSSYNAYEITDWGVVSGNYNVKIVDQPNYIYFDNSQIAFGTSNAYVVVGHDKPTAYSSTYAFGTPKPITNTKLYYYNNTGNTWRDATYYAFLQNSSSFGGGSWGSSNLSTASKYTAAYTTATDLSWDKLYLFIPASGSNGAALSLQTATAASGLNNTQTVKYALSIDGGETFTDMSSGKTPGQITITAHKFVDGTYNGVSSGSQSISGGTTGTYSKSVPAAYTGKTTYSEGSTQTGYTFVGWHDGTSDLGTSNYTDYPTSAKTITARFKANQVTITLNGNSGTGHTASVKATYGVSTLPSITNPTRSGYVFAGWFTGTGGTGKLLIDIDGSLQPGLSGYTDADGNWIGTSNINVYAAWLTVHEPGVYTSTYGQNLTVVSNAAYEVYRYAVNSSTIYFNAGGETAPTVSDEPRRLFSFSQTGTAGACDITWSGWVGHTQVYGKGTNTTTANGEFKAHSVCQPTCRNQQGVIMCVKGYSQFSIYAKDAKATGEKHFKVFINGVAQSMTLNEEDFTIRRFDLTPANTYVIRVTGQTDNNNLIQGISLKVPCVDFTVSRGGQENGTYTVGSYNGSELTCTPSVSGTYTYQWKQYMSGQGVGDTINAVGSGANTASFTPNPASAGTYYYMCRVLNACGDKQVTSTTGTFVFSAAPSCSAPAAPTNFTAGSISATGATFTITDAADAASYDIYYSTESTAPTSGTAATTTSTSKTKAVTGLTAATTYYAWVRSVCDASHKSAWVALNPGGDTHTFATSCVAPTAVNISGTYHYFPGETISLTAAAEGGSGTPTTYQWYKGGTADGNIIEGATSATYTKATCTFEDAGSYYCKVTRGGSCSTFSGNYDVKILRLYVNGSINGDPYGYVDFVKVDGTTATASISLGSGTTYGFNIADGCGNHYGNNGTMQYNSYGPWVTNVTNRDCGLLTTNAATYVFTINYSNWEQLTTTVTFPVANQAAGKVIYFDNNVLQWTGNSIYYRIGHSSHSQADQLSLVPGTANLYKMTTRVYNNFSAWQIGNAEGGNGSDKSIYNTKNTPAITASIAYEGGAVTADAVTVTPGVDHSTGGDAGINDNCEFYSKTITNGMKTQNVSITAPSNGTLTVNYVDVSGAAQAFSSGNRDLAHTCIITVTAVPAAGYAEPATVSINGASHGNRDPYPITGTTVVAATFSPQTYSITYKDQGNVAFSGEHIDTPSAHPTSHTYNTATTLNSATKAGYTFDGWYTTSACTGAPVTSLGATDYTADITLYAKWTEEVTYTVTYQYNGATGDASPASETAASMTLPTPTRTSYEFDGWYTTAGTKVGDGGDTYNPTADITLYARWETACAAGSTTIYAMHMTAYNSYSNDESTTGTTTLAFADDNTETVSDVIYYKPNNTNAIVVDFSASAYTLQAGDVITFYCVANNSTSKTVGFGIKASNSGDVVGTASVLTNKTRAAASYTVEAETALVGVNKIWCNRASSETRFHDMKITRSGGGGGTCYHVYYHGNGAESGFISDPGAYANSASVTVLAHNAGSYPLVKDGYAFQGWATTPEGDVAKTAGQTVTISSDDVHLYAVWSSCDSPDAPVSLQLDSKTTTTATFSWDPAGVRAYGYSICLVSATGTGTFDWKDESLNSYTATGLTSNTAYTFKVKAYGATGCLSDESTVDITTTAAEYTITYNLNGASWAGGYSAPTGYTEGVGATLPIESNMTNTGYTFGGWYDNSGLTGSSVTAIGTSDYGNKEFWAKWTENEYDVTYDKNGGSGDAMSATHGHYVTISDNSYTAPDGKIFVEWNTANDGSGASYNPGDEIELTADLPLYAIWATNYTISWGIVQLGGAGDEVKPNLGGGNYTITASVSAWTGTLTADMISTLTDGVTITNVSVENSSSPKTITATFAVGADVDGDKITLQLDIPAAGVYGAKTSEKEIDIDRCTGSSSGSDGVLFSAEFKDSGLGNDNICDAANDPYTFTTTELKSAPTGGSIKAYTTGDLNHLKYVDNGVYLKGANAVIEIDLDNEIRTNDLFEYVNVHSSNPNAYLRHTSPTTTSDQIVLTGYSSRNVKVMLPAAFDGKTKLFIVRNSTDFKLHKAAVVRPAFLMLVDDEASTGNLEGTDVELTTSTYLSVMKGGHVYYTSPTSGDVKITQSSSKNYITLAKTAGYLKVVLNDALQEDDIIGFDTSNGSSEICFATTTTRSTDEHTSSQLYTVGSSSPLKEQTTFYIWYYSSSTTIRGLQIARSGIAGGGGGTDKITPTLTWETDLSGGVPKRTSDGGFVHTASQDKNSLGAITYSSNNTAVATVNATTGEVHLEGAAGEATITATIAASGCYNTASVSYVVTVEDDCDDVAGTITTRDLECEGTELTIEGYTSTGSETFQWYKDDVLQGSYTAEKCTVTVAGSYYVIVTNTGDRHCAKRSRNTVEVAASASASATKIVDSWYVKNGRRTPDVALVQTEGATGFFVKVGDDKIWDEANSITTGFGGCGFHMDENGIIYLNGTTAEDGSGDAPSGLTAGDVTLKITAEGCGNSASELSITIHCQESTTRKSIAFVVDGTEKGTFAQANADHSTNSALYQFLDHGADEKGAFDLTAQNIYSTTDEKAIREHFSQFDAIIITDDPNTKKNPANKSGDYYKNHGYVNAFGTMIDVRPILSMEAYVSRLTNWGAKGVAGDPSSPNPRQYEMRLECKDHEIYSGLPAPAAGTHVWAEIINGDEYRHVIMVDSTKSPYNGVAYNADTEDKPALQGFESEDMGSLLGLGLISDGNLHTGIERQDEPAARMMILGVQAKALPNALTEEGKKVIENALTYLLKTNMEEVDDCSNFFIGGTSGKETDWNTATNWAKNTLPTFETRVRILAPCEISNAQVRVAQVDIATSGTSSKIPGGTCSGQLTIMADGALVVGGKVRTADAPHFAANDLKPTTVNDLIINTNGSGQAALIFDNEEAKTKATVNYYSLGRKEGSAYQFQYFAVPMEYVDVNPAFAGSGIYTYVWHEDGGWERRGYYTELYAFEGVGITTKFNEAYHNYTMKGTLASTAEKEITLTANDAGDNIIGNSWMAPINIASLRTGLVGDANVDKAVYIYCTGNDGVSVHTGDTEEAGQWLAIPIDASGWSGWDGLKVIPAMQAFLIHANAETTLTLNYKDHVRSTALGKLNEPLRAPGRRMAHQNEFMGMRMRVTDSQTHTDLYLFEGEQFSEAYDNGWEAKFVSGDGRSAQFYAMNGDEKMAVLATDELEGTPVGFTPGKESNYTISFFGDENGYYLNDIKLRNSVRITEGETYTFTFEEGDAANRFYISRTAINAPQVTTGVSNTGDGVKAKKILYNDKLYIIVNGRVYSADGAIVK